MSTVRIASVMISDLGQHKGLSCSFMLFVTVIQYPIKRYQLTDIMSFHIVRKYALLITLASAISIILYRLYCNLPMWVCQILLMIRAETDLPRCVKPRLKHVFGFLGNPYLDGKVPMNES